MNPRQIDLTRPCRTFRTLRFGKYVLVVLCTQVFISMGLTAFLAEDPIELATILTTCALVGGAAYVGWSNIGNLGLFGSRAAAWVFALLVAFSGAMVALIVPELALDDSAEQLELVSAAATCATLLIGAIFGLLGVWRGNRARVAELNVRVVELLRRSELAAQPGCPSRPRQSPPARPLLGLLFVGLALLFYIAINLVPMQFYYESGLGRSMAQLSLIGAVLIIYARHFFAPTFDSVLRNDRRPPVLFLRSFNDEKWSMAQSSEHAMFDFSLESRLAGYFSSIGPFIAIGAPKDHSPHLGAARAHLSDDQWQSQVVSWMQQARIIVLMVGVSHWLTWELKQVVSRGYASKLIVLFPEETSIGCFRRRKVRRRFEHLRQSLAHTPWAPALERIDMKGVHRIRSIVLERDGELSTVVARTRSRDTYHLAAVVAHRLIERIPAESFAAQHDAVNRGDRAATGTGRENHSESAKTRTRTALGVPSRASAA